MKITWLASYPKSGNTWLRFFLYNYFYGEPRKSDDVARRIPDIHIPDSLSASKADDIFCKTHLMLSPQHPHLAQTVRYIYILRHPKDVLLSNLNYFKLIGNGNLDETQFIMDFIENLGVSRWRAMGMGNWVEHARSWLSKAQYPFILLKYEDLMNQPHKGFHRVIEFLSGAVEEERLNRAVHASSFQKIKHIEDKEKKKQRYGVVFAGNQSTTSSGYRFMNKGLTQQSLVRYGDHLDDEFDARFHQVLAEFNY